MSDADGVSGADGQQRETSGRRGWWLVGLLAVGGAAIGAYAGHRLDPDVQELAPSLAVAGFGLGGLVGMLLLAPVGAWRAWRRRRARRAATSPDPAVPDSPQLWHSDDPAAAAEPDPEPEPEEPPPPPGEEPGWYPDPERDGLRRYWDGHAWTGHVWRGRTPEPTRKARNRR